MGDMVSELVKGSAQSLLEAAVAQIHGEIVLVWGFKDDFKAFQKKLRGLNGLLSGAGSKLGSGSSESENELLKDWLEQVGEVAYRAEDVVDEYAYELLKRKLALRDMKGMKPMLRLKTKIRFFCFSRSSNPLLLRFRMAHKVKSLGESIAEVYGEAQRLGIRLIDVAAGVGAGSSSTLAGAEKDLRLELQREQADCWDLVGRDHDKAQIMEWLLQASKSDKLLNVIGIHGMAGLGKTTLCRRIYQTEEVNEWFKERIWICVSHDFDFQRLLKGMIEQSGEQSTMSDIEAIKKKVRDKLQGKKYLLVLDDIWTTFETAWEPLRDCLLYFGGSKGSAILVTSRNVKVLEKLETFDADPKKPMDYPRIYPLRGLSEPDSWSLLKQRVGDDLSDSIKESLARKMLGKCKGVPLAIKTIASLLRSRKETYQWKEIEESGIWNEVDDITLPSIRLSFKYLPSVALKRCFVYCGIFQEDEKIQKDKLIQLWMAQGFLLHPHHDMEQVGEEYFHILINNSLFQDLEFDKWGDLLSCKMHDAVHALARDLSRNDIAYHVRHLSLLDSQQQSAEKLEHNNNLRTLFLSFHPSKLDNFKMEMVKCLRALSLVRVGLKELPDSIGELKHLKYLDISANEISSLPDGFTKLYNLYTLRVRPTGMFPKFPKGFDKLVNLRHITSSVFDEMDIPVGLGMLTCLQTLPPIYASKNWGGRLSELQTLTNLKGKLMISSLRSVEIREAEVVTLGMKKSINSLILKFGGGSGDRLENQKMVLEALQPPASLAYLGICDYYAKALPEWMLEMQGYGGLPLKHLVYLKIDNFKRLEHCTMSLKNLIALKKLRIECCDNMIFFPKYLECVTSLQERRLRLCKKMQNLVADLTPLVNLRKVEISYCRNMTSLPIGLLSLPRLESATLGTFNPELDSFPFPHANYEYCNVLPGGLNENRSSQFQRITASKERTTMRSMKSLVELHLYGRGMDKIKSLPDPIQYLHQLRSLGIWSFYGLESLPEWLGNLTSLRELELQFLQNLKCLPSHATMGHLKQLVRVEINRCNLLKDAFLDKERGTEWSKIEHISDVIIQWVSEGEHKERRLHISKGKRNTELSKYI